MNNTQKIITTALLFCGFSTAVLAYTAEDSYIAVSKTAESITGDIQFDDFSITFANGETLEFSSLVANNFKVDGDTVPASVYRVSEPSDPELENGNYLCGSGDVTYVASWGADPQLMTIAVFTGKRPPRDSSEMCASYTYGIE